MAGLRLSAAQLDSTARLEDDPALLPLLRRARLSRDTALLAMVVRSGGGAAAYRTLVEVQRRAPEPVRAIMEHPRFGAWAAACSSDPAQAEHLASFTASAAILGHAPFDLEIPAVGGWVVLPSIGAIKVAPGTESVRLRGDDGAAWRPLRRIPMRLHATASVELEFDEFPFVAVAEAQLTPAQPQSDQSFELWRGRLPAAMDLLWRTVPRLAEPLAQGMRTILPLADSVEGASAASLADAFGAAAMTLPPDVGMAATTLLHEFQHSKLSVLSEIVPLVAGSEADLHSPWKAEPRPASAVLHGAFAHLAVARLWAGWAREGRTGWGEADLTREQVLSACRVLARSGRLTDAGRRFVTTLAQTAQGLRRTGRPLPDARIASRLPAQGAEPARARRQNPASLRHRHPDSARSE